jgi:hypothetical protein
MTVSVSTSLRGALRDFYEHSWRLVALNCALSLCVLAILAAASFWAPALLLLLLLGPLAAAMMHCAVSLVREGELSLRDAAAGLVLHWRRGLGLAALSGVVILAGLAGVRAYGGASTLTWPLAFALAYLLGLFCVYQLVLWPLAVAEREVPLRQVLGDALRTLTGRPGAALVLAFLLLLVNALGALAALLPLFTLTIAYSFLAAARFTLPPQPVTEA